MKSSRPVPSVMAGDRNVRFWESAEGISVEVNDGAAVPINRGVTVDPADLAEALNEMPGFTVKYVKPVVIPQYLGAVVEREQVAGEMLRWIRVYADDVSSVPWYVTNSGRMTDNDTVAGVLANGGYEREPEFPTRTP